MTRRLPRLAPAITAALILSSLGGCSKNGKHAKDEGEEKTLTRDQLPGPVAATLARESAGGEVKEIEREMKKGKTVYEADVLMGGKTWELKIAEDGTLLSKELD